MIRGLGRAVPRVRAIAWRSRRHVGMIGFPGMLGFVVLTHDLLLNGEVGIELWLRFPCGFLRASRPAVPGTVVRMRLLFLAHPLERFVVSLLVDEAAGFGIALRPAVIGRVVGLGSLFHLTDAMTVSVRGIFRH